MRMMFWFIRAAVGLRGRPGGAGYSGLPATGEGGNLASAVVLAPISFLSDHMEVLYDLDVEARQLCDSLGLTMSRAKTVGVHPKFIGMIRQLILRADESTVGAAGGGYTRRAS